MSLHSKHIVCFYTVLDTWFWWLYPLWQKDNVSNQREHVVHLLANGQSRLGIPEVPEPVGLIFFPSSIIIFENIAVCIGWIKVTEFLLYSLLCAWLLKVHLILCMIDLQHNLDGQLQSNERIINSRMLTGILETDN